MKHKRSVKAKIKPPTEKRIMKWEMRNMLRTSSCIPIMVEDIRDASLEMVGNQLAGQARLGTGSTGLALCSYTIIQFLAPTSSSRSDVVTQSVH